jgi:hypothetical protein
MTIEEFIAVAGKYYDQNITQVITNTPNISITSRPTSFFGDTCDTCGKPSTVKLRWKTDPIRVDGFFESITPWIEICVDEQACEVIRTFS